jgi:ubiquinol-cytochrome c reductase cytochrome b subunit
VLPALLATLIGVHLALVMARHHTQFKESERQTNSRIVGLPLFPAQAFRSLALMLFVVGILFLLGGLVQINPIWQWGPYEPWLGTNGAQPDWYLGWLIGALRLMPGFDVTLGHHTLIPNPFWGGALFPLAVLGVLITFPWVERRLTGDRGVHNLADRPREHPFRTAFGLAFLTFVFLIFAFGAADRLYVLFGLSYAAQLTIFRIAIFVIPALVFIIARRICRELQIAESLDRVHEQVAELNVEAHELNQQP